MNWHIGQEIVCIKTHPDGIVKRGKVYRITGLKKPFCGCHQVQIDVGIIGRFSKTNCSMCGKKSADQSYVWWLSEKRFAPLEYNQDAINELLEEPVLVNK